MTAPTIEHGIPVPPRGKWAALFRSMKKGDSFLVGTATERHTVLRKAWALGIKVTTRKVPNVGYRV